MKCCDGAGLREKSGEFPCGVCGKFVGANSIKSTSCMNWIHKKFSGVKGRLQAGIDFQCRTCGESDTTTLVEKKEMKIGVNEKLECLEQFCHLRDMIGAGGWC